MDNLEVISKHKWLQHAAKWIYKHGAPTTDEKVSEFVDLCKKEANGESFPDVDHPQYFQNPAQKNIQELRLVSIGEIKGVNSLAPSKPLEFEESKNITVVYGLNGSGKSSYVRLLKHVCGARVLGKLHSNVYNREENIQQARVEFKNEGKKDKVIWDGKETREELRHVHIFDHSFEDVFVDGDEVSYEPSELFFISSLIKICDRVREKLSAEKDKHPSRRPEMSPECKNSEEGKWFQHIGAKTSDEELEKHCAFDAEDKEKLAGLYSSKDRVENLAKKKIAIDKILKDVRKHLAQLSDEACKRIIALNKDSIKKREAARVAAKQAFGNDNLKGIASDIWIDLWNAARKYSQEEAYKGREFPVVKGDDAVCILCHQSLSEDTKKRFVGFERHVKASIEIESRKAHDDWIKAVREIKDTADLPEEDCLMESMGDAGIKERDVRKALCHLYFILRDRKEKLSASKPESEILAIPDCQCIAGIKYISNGYEQDIKTYSEKGNEDQFNSLKARKWLSENRTAIEVEIKRFQCIEKIIKAQKLTDTTSLSKQKGNVAKKLISEPFVKRFNEELKALGASNVKVEIKQDRTQKGAVRYKIILTGTSGHPLKEVLSEGERRVVSIAAFLADINAKEQSSPVVFDDPTSSLDQNFEESCTKRLYKLSSKRQVIVFTHRLQFLTFLTNEDKKRGIDTKFICKNNQRAGELQDIYLNVSTKQAIERLRSKIKNEEVKGLCVDFRKLVERVIEDILLSGIVGRCRLNIHTNKIRNLPKITDEDTNFLDELMSKYSRHLHQQPEHEHTVPLPNHDELKKDLDELGDWVKKFDKEKVVR